ncbi:MAG TPA: hypothetical protein VFM70_09000 [Salinimicrobium sp.]|nr:hypothetical protein [Salinimicrobium sp.]
MRYLIFLLLMTSNIFAQESELLERLVALDNNGLTFYNMDGYNITSQTFNDSFTEKNLKKVYRKYSVKKESKTKDEKLPFNNYYVTNDEKITEKLVQNNSFYFVENPENNRITVIHFSAINKRDKDFERTILIPIIKKTIPRENYVSTTIDSINFAGRKIKLGNNCYWTHINAVQCPYYGEMNWSVHKDLEDAKNTVEQQFEITKSRKNGKVISEEIVEIIFEGTETEAKKVIYDFTGMTSVLASMSEGKTLTIFYVAAKVRNNYVSCVLSFWNNDAITENGLAPLLEEVMQLKK